MSILVAPEHEIKTLHDLCKVNGHNTYDTAKALGVSQPRISQILSTGTKDIDQLAALAAFWQVDFDDVRNASDRLRLPLKSV